jgi:hypothetical protein
VWWESQPEFNPLSNPWRGGVPVCFWNSQVCECCHTSERSISYLHVAILSRLQRDATNWGRVPMRSRPCRRFGMVRVWICDDRPHDNLEVKLILNKSGWLAFLFTFAAARGAGLGADNVHVTGVETRLLSESLGLYNTMSVPLTCEQLWIKLANRNRLKFVSACPASDPVKLHLSYFDAVAINLCQLITCFRKLGEVSGLRINFSYKMKFQEDIRTLQMLQSSWRRERKIRKRKSSIILAISVCLSTRNNSTNGERIFVRFGIREFH